MNLEFRSIMIDFEKNIIKKEYHNYLNKQLYINSKKTNFYCNLFIGLYDSESKKIYENDIIQIQGYHKNNDDDNNDILFLVEYYNDLAMFVLSPFVKGDFDAPILGVEEQSQNFSFLEDCKHIVIGNIYENYKELLGLDFPRIY